MNRKIIRIGTRGSRLALVQVNIFLKALKEFIPDIYNRVQIVKIDSKGDKDKKSFIDDLGPRGVFTNELDISLQNREVDLTVHSAKDLPECIEYGLTIASVLKREDPREAFVSKELKSLESVPFPLIMGSASHRRIAFVRRLKRNVRFSLLRGNIEERINLIETGNIDATILAVAGLKRLNLQDRIKQVFSLNEFPPDPAQGAIALVSRSDDKEIINLLSLVNHLPSFYEITAERRILSIIGEERSVPFGCYAVSLSNGEMNLNVMLTNPDGSETYHSLVSGSYMNAIDIGNEAANSVLSRRRKDLVA